MFLLGINLQQPSEESLACSSANASECLRMQSSKQVHTSKLFRNQKHSLGALFYSRSQIFYLHHLDLGGVQRSTSISAQRLVRDLVDGRDNLKQAKVLHVAKSDQRHSFETCVGCPLQYAPVLEHSN